MPYYNIDLGQQWLMKWLVAIMHQAITWTNVNLSLKAFWGIYMRAVSQELMKILIHEIKFENYPTKCTATSPRAKKLKHMYKA